MRCLNVLYGLMLLFYTPGSSCQRHGEPPVALTLTQAVKTGRLKAVEKALHNAKYPNTTDAEGSTPLHWACAVYPTTKERMLIIQRLLAAGAKIDASDANGWTPLFWAITNSEKHKEIKGVTQAPHQANKNNAVLEDEDHVVDLLLRYKPALNIQDIEGNTPLYHAVTKQDAALVEALLEQGANPDIKGWSGVSALWHAFLQKSEPIVCLLLKHSKDIHSLVQGTTLLHVAVRAPIGENQHVDPKDIKTIQLLLDKGFNTHIQDAKGCTALHYAVIRGIEIVRLLLTYKVPLNAQDQVKRTALHYAAYGGDVKIIELLLEKGADPSLLDQEGHAPLWYAQQKQHKEAIALLTEKTQEEKHTETRIGTN
ncbi:MAG TPA: ankyrin repeat domain-containing protein [Amoebophilaceae bacterium]|nr:ankyrin repeat domain-containing protein [Amoebophilaceae bacterium]